MPYVQRDAHGQITSLHQEAPFAGAEELAPDHPDIITFLYGGAGKSDLLALDLEFIRVIEDLVDLLVARNVIHFTDLPAPVQSKLNRRQLAREHGSVSPEASDIIPL